jgi:DNA-binding HxlR family transcriptional regulator
VKISALLETPSVKILLYYMNMGMRCTELTKLIASGGTLSLNTNELEEDGLLERRIMTSNLHKRFTP